MKFWIQIFIYFRIIYSFLYTSLIIILFNFMLFVCTVLAGLHDMVNHGLTTSVNCACNKIFFINMSWLL